MALLLKIEISFVEFLVSFQIINQPKDYFDIRYLASSCAVCFIACTLPFDLLHNDT